MAKRWVIGGLAVGVGALVLAPEARTWLRRRLGLEPEDRRWFEEEGVENAEHEGDEPLDTREARFSLRARLAEEGHGEPAADEPAVAEPAAAEPATAAVEPEPEPSAFPAFPPAPAAALVPGVRAGRRPTSRPRRSRAPRSRPSRSPSSRSPPPRNRPRRSPRSSRSRSRSRAPRGRAPGRSRARGRAGPSYASYETRARDHAGGRRAGRAGRGHQRDRAVAVAAAEPAAEDEPAEEEEEPPPPPTMLRPPSAPPNRPFSSSEGSSFRSAIDAARERVHGAAREATPDDEGENTEPLDERS